MARAQSQYLRFYDAGGTTYRRWQSYYGGTTVTWASQQWTWMPFEADGFSAGVSGDETSITLTAPANSEVVSAFTAAISGGQLVDLSLYMFDPTAGNTTPQSSQTLVASFTGQVVGGTASITTMGLQLGSALSPVGVQIPPLKFTTQIMGMGCKL
jgi:hypothetical protein